MSATRPRGTTITVSDYGVVRDAFRRKELRQALYDDGADVMADCLLTLHGDSHRARRRLENRLFRRDVFTRWERQVLGTTVDDALAPFVAEGRGDLLPIGYRTTMNLTAFIAGVDRPHGTPDETEELYRIVRTFSEGATAVHSTRDRAALSAEVQAAMDLFDRDFFSPSVRRREATLAAGGDAPDDVLGTLLAHRDELDLPTDVIRREVAFYLQAGSHSTANAFTHTVDELFSWVGSHPEDLERARRDLGFLQRCVHETLRLHPASPVAWRRAVAPVDLADGTTVGTDDLLVLDLEQANRSTDLFGEGADRFDPWRVPADGVPAWGHSFGGGVHACIGMELDGGLECPPTPDDSHLFGTVAVMVSAFLAHGGRPDPDHPPTVDRASSRTHFSAYPVLFDGMHP